MANKLAHQVLRLLNNQHEQHTKDETVCVFISTQILKENLKDKASEESIEKVCIDLESDGYITMNGAEYLIELREKYRITDYGILAYKNKTHLKKTYWYQTLSLDHKFKFLNIVSAGIVAIGTIINIILLVYNHTADTKSQALDGKSDLVLKEIEALKESDRILFQDFHNLVLRIDSLEVQIQMKPILEKQSR